MTKRERKTPDPTNVDTTGDALRARLFVGRELRFDGYLGSKADLIAAGLAAEGMFPGDPGCHRRTMVTHKGRPMVRIQKRPRGAFLLRRCVAKAESHWRLAMQQAKRANERAVERERAWITGLPASVEQFRNAAIGYAKVSLSVRRIFEALGAGYHFAPSAMEEFEAALVDALDELAEAPVIYRKSEREACVTALKAETAKADVGFQVAMSQIVSRGGRP